MSALKRGIDKIKKTSYLIPNISNSFAFSFSTGYYNFFKTLIYLKCCKMIF